MVDMMILLAAFAAADAAPEAEFMRNMVHNETGFTGAVTVIESDVKDGVCVVTVGVPYRDLRGDEKMGQGRLTARRDIIESGKPLPPYCNVHYEMDLGGAKPLCDQGWVVITPHYGDPDAKTGYKLELALGDSYNLANALIQWVRRLTFVDRARLFIAGGSAGGYMALATGAQTFPVAAILSDFPVVNWAYNLSYFESNTGATKYREAKEVKDTAMPILWGVSMLTDWAYGVFGKDLASDAYYIGSPIAYLNRITCPVLVTTATGDLLVPIEQTALSHSCPSEPGACPEGFTRDIQKLAPTDKTRTSLTELLPQGAFTEFIIPLPEGLHEYDRGELGAQAMMAVKSPPVERPWSKDHQWSIVILNEGPPIATSAHSRYAWNLSAANFTITHQSTPASLGSLTSVKLDWLMRRYDGNLNESMPLADGSIANRLNFPALEKRDVITGLLDYARISPEHAARLQELYPLGSLKPFGPELDLEKLETLLNS